MRDGIAKHRSARIFKADTPDDDDIDDDRRMAHTASRSTPRVASL